MPVQLVEEITQMNLLEIADLTELLRKRLNITAPPPGAFLGGQSLIIPSCPCPALLANTVWLNEWCDGFCALAGMPGAPGGGAAPAVVAEAPKEAEKTEFDVKLTGFEAASKIKVIKEVRAVTSLGLKEAKELVSVQSWVARSVAGTMGPASLHARLSYMKGGTALLCTFIYEMWCFAGGEGASRHQSRPEKGGGR